MAPESNDSPPERPPVERFSFRSMWTNPAYRFVLLFLVYLGLVAFLYPKFRFRFPGLIDDLTHLTAQLEYWVMLPFVENLTLSGNILVYENFSIRVIEECTGIYEVLIFVAAVSAFPTSWSKKCIGVGLGIPILYLFNLARMIFLIVVGNFWPNAFDFMHLYFWQATLIMMITGVWLLWIFKVVQYEKAPLPAVP